MRSESNLGTRPALFLCDLYLVPVEGETKSSSISSWKALSTKVVEQMLLDIIIDGYIDLKSRTATHDLSPGSTSCTYPPAICSPLRP